VNQARVLDYFAQFAVQSPGRITPDYGIEFVDLVVDSAEAPATDHPVSVTVRYTAGERAGEERTIRAGYVVGCDGARSKVRSSIGRKMTGDQANHAWGVMDVLANSDFPDIRTKCAISSKHGNILHIPREGGHLFRMYVDLGEVPEDDARRVRQTSIDEIISRANAIIAPYSLDVKNVAWHSVYEVGHRLTVPARVHHRRRLPHPLGEGRSGHERVDAGRLQHRVEARSGHLRSLVDGAAADLFGRTSGHGEEPHRLRQGMVDADGDPAGG